MRELNQVLGAILTDITKARVASDLYAREVFKSYREDVILQHFPVPRVDISGMEIELKLAISRTKSSFKGDCSDGVYLQDELLGFCKEITRKFVEEYVQLLISNEVILLNLSNQHLINAKKESESYMIAFAKDIASKLYYEMDGLTSVECDNKVVRNNKLLSKIQIELSNSDFCKEIEIILIKDLVSDEQKSNVKKLLRRYSNGIVSEKLKEMIETNADKVFDMLEKDDTQGIYVAVTTEELKDIPDTKMTSMKMAINIQNYGISQVEDEGMFENHNTEDKDHAEGHDKYGCYSIYPK